MTERELHQLSWAELDQLVDLLARRLEGQAFEAVVGIARSGLVPAVVLAHRLGIRAFSVLDIKRTESDGIESPKSLPRWDGVADGDALGGKRVLLVDDIVGQGLTLELARKIVRERCASLTTCVLVVNQRNLGPRRPNDVVDHFGCLVHGWVRFPWERKHG